LTFTGQSGVLVERTTASRAAAQIEPIKNRPVTAAGPCAELSMIAAGAVLNEAMIGAGAAAAPRITLFYSLQRRRRIDCPVDMSLNALLAELAAPITRATFAGKRGVELGIGGLGNPAAIAIALDRHPCLPAANGVNILEKPKKLSIIDADSEIARSNLNRQVLFSNQALQGSKAQVAASVLQKIDPQGFYAGKMRLVKNNADLELQDADYLLVLPDNDEARLIAADAAWDKGVVMATAATSATSGYAVVQQPDQACLRCAAHLEQPPNVLHQRESCNAVEEDAIIPTNMVAAGVAVSELREAMSGRPATNLRFHGTNVVGNCLARKASPRHCAHGHGAGMRDCSLAAT
jgi:molybdopterin/thiamine biosynthesis adenylyltransferase